MKTTAITSVSLLAALLLSLAPARGQMRATDETEAVDALAKGDWRAALAALPEQAQPPPVIRALRGHCLLVLNRNDEALACFVSLWDPHSCVDWAGWTESFVERFPSNSIALYLHGDGLARQGRWADAVASYDRALEIEPAFAPALNARGIAECKLGESAAAWRDFEAACSAAPAFADARASLGVFWIQHGAPESAAPCFEKALALSTNAALFLNGKGCAMFDFGTNDNLAFDLFRKAADVPVTATLACRNAGQLLVARAEATKSLIVSNKPGTTISTADLMAQRDKLTDNINFNVKTLQVLPWVPNLSFDHLGWEKTDITQNTMRNLDSQRQQLANVNAQLGTRGFMPGGLSTSEMGNSRFDSAKWPVTTWFGLAQEAPAAPTANN